MPASVQVRGGANFHRQLFILMAVRVIEPLSITQLFAYINPMMSHILPPTTDQADIGKYSGLIEAAFAIGTFLTMYQWGRLSDRIGRKPAILSGLTGIAVTTLAFGLSGNFYMAFIARLFGKYFPPFQKICLVAQKALVAVLIQAEHSVGTPRSFELLWERSRRLKPNPGYIREFDAEKAYHARISMILFVPSLRLYSVIWDMSIIVGPVSVSVLYRP